jgi:protein ImuB
MRRILCVWLPRFLTDRLTRTQSEPATQQDALLAITASGKGGNRLVAVNASAEATGLKPGMLLTEATAIAPELRALPQDAQQEAAHLRRLALWCRRYTPWVAPDAPDSLRLDITGAAHLVGGEAALLRDIRGRFMRAGFSCRAAIAGTPAATLMRKTKLAPWNPYIRHDTESLPNADYFCGSLPEMESHGVALHSPLLTLFTGFSQ